MEFRRHHVAHGAFVRRWIGPHASMLGFEVAEEPPRTIHENVLDTLDRRIQRAGAALVAVRGASPESERTGAGGDLVWISLDGAPEDSGPSAERRASLVLGRRPTQLLLGVHTTATRFALRLRGVELAAIELEESELTLPGTEPQAMHTAVLDPAASDVELSEFFRALVASCGTTPALPNRVLDALRATGLDRPPAIELGPTGAPRGASAGNWALAAMRRQLAAAWRNEPGARLGEDPERLHDFRVALRRLRAAIALGEEILPARILRLEPLLRWLMRGTNEVRDLQVQLAQWKEWAASIDGEDRAAFDDLVRLLEERRRRAHERMVRHLDSRRAARVFERAAAALGRPVSPRSAAGRYPILVVAPDLILERRRRFLKAGRKLRAGSPPSRFHRARIRAKQLRYAIEFHRELYGEPAVRCLAKLAELQDLLGLHQDAVVASERLRSLLGGSVRGLSSRALFVLGILAERSASRARALRRKFPRAFDSMSGKRWKALHAALEAGRLPENDHASRALSSWNRRRSRGSELPAGSGASAHEGGGAPDAAGGAGSSRDEGFSGPRADEPVHPGYGDGADRGGGVAIEEVAGRRDGTPPPGARIAALD